MATSTYKVLCLLVALTLLNSETIAAVKNTIFADEKIEGGAFQYLDAFRSANESNTAYRDYRLPITTRPIHYDVLWKIDVENKSFSGRVDIKLVATQANVNEVVIHSASYLTLASTVLTLDATDIPITVEAQPEFDFLRIRLNSGSLQYDAAAEVIYTLSISFAAPLRTDMHGLFIHLYQDDGSIPSSMVASHFKTSYTRSALPCYDEPRFKATFDVVISRPSDFSSWFSSRFNGSRSGDTGYVEDIYRRTPRMSSYLLALVVGNLQVLFNFHPDRSLRHELIFPILTENDVLPAFEMGYEAIDKMGEHTGINYYTVDENMKKMTHAVIPYFAVGTSENWGLIMSREAYAVYDGTHMSDYYSQLMLSLIGKQIAHMWFGSVVTNEFWDCLWLNEGFGRYYQYFLTHWVDRGYGYMGLDTRFIPEQVHTGLLSDSAPGASPLTSPAVGSPASVAAMFSPITLNKGAAVIRMTEHLLGFEIHRQGLQSYLRNRYLDTAVPNDLFEALQTVAVSSDAISAYDSDFSVVDYYRSWTEKGGHPVLFVRVDHQTGDMVVQQRRFDINTGYSSDGSEWIVPVSFATASNPNFANTKPSHIIREAVTIIDRGTVGDEWVIFNKQQTGFYRVNYDEYTWDLIVLALRGEDRTKIHEYNRAQIVDDVFQFARSGVMNYTRAFNILSFLEHETEYAPWAAAVTGFTWLRSRLTGTPDLASLDQMIIRWAAHVMSGLAYSSVQYESFMRAYLRRQLAPLMCAAGVRECREVAKYQFWYMTAGGQVSPNNRHWVYCNGLREGSESDFDALWQRYQNAGPRLDVERLQILGSIGCTPHASRINLLLTNIVEDNDLILKQDYALALNSILDGNDGNALVVFAYIRDNLPAIIDALGSAAVLSDVAARLRTTEHLAEFENWATANRNALGDAYDSIMESAELSRQSIAWVATVRDDIGDYLVNGDQDISTTTTTTTSPTTVSRPDLEVPDTPNIPASAVTAFVSVTAVVFVAFAFASQC